jgi:hypothetical protein
LICDWLVSAFNLPPVFLAKNQGGGAVCETVADSLLLSVHVAKRRKVNELGLKEFDPRLVKFVAYYSENADESTLKGNV